MFNALLLLITLLPSAVLFHSVPFLQPDYRAMPPKA